MTPKRRLPAWTTRTLATGAAVVGILAATLTGSIMTSAASHFSAAAASTVVTSTVWLDI
ncbi:hypothetical protein GCM10009687_64060 [Asanoa iriomotensis]|uniref:Uncharacterized protein n=1 Tax=Asanoa iriomotensis TaxID=234613 RepID=A0ABQ4C926_9ACTN|nr:hypothetical protein Air01nite_49050 [Asanoa iriomotensis]